MPVWIRATIGVIAAVLLISLGSALTISQVEENNAFCASCHTPLEVLYVNQADQATPENSPNLAAFHYAITAHRENGAVPVVNCVACHRGDNGVQDRTIALTLGAWNTVRWLMGDDGTGAAERRRLEWLPNNSCLRCHSDVFADRNFENHYHFYLPEYNQDPIVQADAEANVLYCNACHVSHDDIPQELDFLADEIVFPACKKCHVVWGRGPQGDLN